MQEAYSEFLTLPGEKKRYLFRCKGNVPQRGYVLGTGGCTAETFNAEIKANGVD
jgi:hypothetical protein